MEPLTTEPFDIGSSFCAGLRLTGSPAKHEEYNQLPSGLFHAFHVPVLLGNERGSCCLPMRGLGFFRYGTQRIGSMGARPAIVAVRPLLALFFIDVLLIDGRHGGKYQD